MSDTTTNGKDPLDEKLELLMQTVAVITEQLDDMKELLDDLYEKVTDLSLSGDGFGDLDLN